MNRMMIGMLSMVAAMVVRAQPARVAVVDFDDQTGAKPDAALGGAVGSAALAQKGVFVLGQRLLGREAFTLIDRRDFIAQMEKLHPTDAGKPTPTRPSFLQAAQALRADVVLRGAIQGFSVGKESVNQGGHQADFSTLSLRVGVEALDPHDGAVIAMASGTAQTKVRQTQSLQTTLGEEEVLTLMEKAVDAALPQVEAALSKRMEAQKNRPVVKLNIKTSADPALVEIDGILVGTTPIEGLEVYKGDHVLTVGKPGHRDVTKRILFEQDSRIDVPMMRTEMSADEVKEILEKGRLNMILGDPGITILPLQ